MNSFINRESLIKTILETPFTMSMCLSEQECHGANRARQMIAHIIETELPPADVVEVVRCKDCMFTERDGAEDPAIYCQKWDMWEMPSNGYCFLGKRRKDTNERN